MTAALVPRPGGPLTLHPPQPLLTVRVPDREAALRQALATNARPVRPYLDARPTRTPAQRRR